jgi:hypothetical protein
MVGGGGGHHLSAPHTHPHHHPHTQPPIRLPRYTLQQPLSLLPSAARITPIPTTILYPTSHPPPTFHHYHCPNPSPRQPDPQLTLLNESLHQRRLTPRLPQRQPANPGPPWASPSILLAHLHASYDHLLTDSPTPFPASSPIPSPPHTPTTRTLPLSVHIPSTTRPFLVFCSVF